MSDSETDSVPKNRSSHRPTIAPALAPPLDETNLVLDTPSSNISKKRQAPRMQQYLDSVVLGTYKVALLKDPFPDATEKAQVVQDILLKAAKNVEWDEIVTRIKGEVKYRKKLGAYGNQRIANKRTELKDKAADEVIAGLQLNLLDTEACKTRVKNLTSRSPVNYPYVFPLDRKTGKFDEEKPFLNSVITTTLRKALAGDGQFKQLIRHFRKTDDGKIMLPSVLTALGATAVHVALCEYRDGERERKKWSAGTYYSVFKDHCDTLHDIRTNHKEHYPQLMAKLYQIAFGNVSADDDNKLSGEERSKHVSAIVKINLDD